MKTLISTMRNLVVEGLSFVGVLTLTLAGIMGLVQIKASIFMLVIFCVLMVPILISTVTYFVKGIHDAIDKLTAYFYHRFSYPSNATAHISEAILTASNKECQLHRNGNYIEIENRNGGQLTH